MQEDEGKGWRQRDQGGAAGAGADKLQESGVHRRISPETQQRYWFQREQKTFSQPCLQFLILCPDGARKRSPGSGAPVIPGAAPEDRRGSHRWGQGGQGPGPSASRNPARSIRERSRRSVHPPPSTTSPSWAPRTWP